jgi:D-alanyl-D-alanine carboxypeptidase
VSLYIPPHPHIDSTITIRQLLNHTSGLGEYAGGPTYRDSILADPRRVWTSNELLAMIPSAQFEPGRSWQYCNSNYLVAGIIAEQVGGKALHTLMQQEIFDVISMDSTRLFPQHDFVGELAHRWMGGRDASALPMNSEWSGAWAAGAVISSASELAQFYRSMFNKVLLSDRSVSELTTFIGPNSYGLGISEQRIGGQVVTGHTGEIRGYTSTAMWVPALSAVVVVLTNELPGKPIAVADTIIRVLSSHVSSVDDDHSLTMSDLFTAKLFDASGNCILDVQDRSALQHINAGMYLLRSSVSQYAAVVILPGGEVALCTRSTAARP